MRVSENGGEASKLFTITSDGGRRIRLSQPLKTHSLEILHLDLRPLRWPDYIAIGELTTAGLSPGGVYVEEVVPDRVRQYAERLLNEDEAEFLPQLSMVDAFKVVSAVRSFFDEARGQQGAPHKGSSSSNIAASDPATLPE